MIRGKIAQGGKIEMSTLILTCGKVASNGNSIIPIHDGNFYVKSLLSLRR